MQAGRLRHRLIVQVPTITGGADWSPAWATYGPYRADVTPLTGRELMIARQAQSQATTKISLRHGIMTILPSYRLGLLNADGEIAKLYQIEAVHNVGERDRELWIQALEIETPDDEMPTLTPTPTPTPTVSGPTPTPSPTVSGPTPTPTPT